MCKENVANILVPTLKYEDFLLFSVHVITSQTGFFWVGLTNKNLKDVSDIH